MYPADPPGVTSCPSEDPLARA